ncbi:helix-turn-helix domain-containing protein [Defluviimonas sp. SAOS-178_SWC]|uniref:helix-turn-helix domain-containing protein n=1 Tax=Defluviimonas sp. SAOS-178_SWC TaxID=3121287 RepID=UPI00322152C1
MLTLRIIGQRIRQIRKSRRMTLQQLAEECGLSTSMLSLVERGRAAPSIGSLIVISETLGVKMSDLTDGNADKQNIVVRSADARVVVTAEDVIRRILTEDTLNDVTVAINEYGPGSASNDVSITHDGHEYGFLLEGELHVEVDGVNHMLIPGDFICYSSQRPHRIQNRSSKKAKTIWFNLGSQ